MFGLTKRWKQIIGSEPLERKHLGQYAFKVDFQDDFTFENSVEFDDFKRLNTDIYLNAYETISFKVSIENRFGKQEFHLIREPFEENGYEVFPVLNDKKVKFFIAIKPNIAFIKIDELMMGTKYFN